MTEWLKGWKVIVRKSRLSCTSDHLVVKYEKDEVTIRPKNGGPLAVFGTRAAARKFLRTGFWFDDIRKLRKVVKCLYKKSNDEHLWSGALYLYTLPKGTAFADEVKCLE